MELAERVASSLKWLASARLAGQVINWAATIWVIRLLAPADYGLMAQAMIVIGLLALINEMGMGAALIQRREINRQIAGQVFTISLLINLLIFTLVCLLAPLIAHFFGEESLTAMTIVLGVGFLFSSLGLVPSAILSREMSFRKKAIVDLAAMLVSSLTTLLMAFSGYGVWALVAGNLTGIVTRTLGVNIAASYWVAPRLNIRGTLAMVKFGSTMTADRALWYLYSQADLVIIGKFLGKELLGYYSVAMQLATLPMQKIAGTMNEVGFAAFSRIQQDNQLFGDHYLKAARILSFFAFPVFWGISATTPEIVYTFIGAKWSTSILPMQLLSLVIPLRMLSTIASPALAGKGRPDVSLKNLLIASLLMPAAFLVGVHWGLTGVCLAWLIVYPVTFAIMHYRTLAVLSIQPTAYLASILRPVIPALLMYLTVMGLAQYLEGQIEQPLFRLLILSAVGATCYAALIWLTQRKLIDEVLSFIRKSN